MSRLTVVESPWRASPGKDTTIDQLARALDQFPQLVLEVAPLTFEISFVLDAGADEAPASDDLAVAMFGEAEGYLVEDSGTFRALEVVNLEAEDRHFEDDQDLV